MREGLVPSSRDFMFQGCNRQSLGGGNGRGLQLGAWGSAVMAI